MYSISLDSLVLFSFLWNFQFVCLTKRFMNLLSEKLKSFSNNDLRKLLTLNNDSCKYDIFTPDHEKKLF